MGELLDQLIEMTGLKAGSPRKSIQARSPIDIPVQICDSRRFRALTGFKPQIPIRQRLPTCRILSTQNRLTQKERYHSVGAMQWAHAA